jgi:hypothetical protein
MGDVVGEGGMLSRIVWGCNARFEWLYDAQGDVKDTWRGSLVYLYRDDGRVVVSL